MELYQRPCSPNPYQGANTSSQNMKYPYGIAGVRNGYVIYKPGFGPYFGPDVPRIPDFMYSDYGWKIVNRAC
ncbi:hypothetical protein [Paenibacillus sp. UASWS1643]|uniref:hypothetical protein n=1 Tax=Paenibacillus sp. UASWS1643 TaxID=2580422 RepID=UPI00123B38EC|nr:hypothetical protein [Paenibacillus sp. UASWS1643]KAA8757773.1 hypothetical protein FE296_00390 [Paenibacillus sp. UASWS1643]